MAGTYQTLLARVALIALSLVHSGCATLGAKLAYEGGLAEEARGCKDSHTPQAWVGLDQCERISRLIRKAGIKDGYVGYDAAGKLRLKGEYDDEEQVDRAFTIAQTVVGAQGTAISDVTPRNVGLIRMIKQAQPADETGLGQGGKHALIIGVSRFKNGFAPIPAAEHDARDYAQFLQAQGFKRVSVLLNEAATRRAILDEFRALSVNAGPDDRLFLYISTHGTPPDKLGKLGIVPYDLGDGVAGINELKRLSTDDASSDEVILRAADLRYRVLKTAITQDDLNDFLGSLHARRSVTVLDTCYSGAALGAITQPLGGAGYRQAENEYTRGLGGSQLAELAGDFGRKDVLVEGAESSGSVGLGVSTTGQARLVDYDYRQLPVPEPEKDAKRHAGRVIVTASRGNEVSRFDAEGRTPIRNSFFSYYFLNGLKRLKGQTGKAFDYASVRTRQLVSDLNRASQTPQMYTSPMPGLNLDIGD
jgi:hypothetical protein